MVADQRGWAFERIALQVQRQLAAEYAVHVIYAADKNPNVQRFKLNTWLDTQYLSTRRQVAAERSLIVDHATPEAWLENFKKYHIPFMKALGLPQSYDHFVGVVAENG